METDGEKPQKTNINGIWKYQIPDRYLVFAFLAFILAISTFLNYCYVKWDASPLTGGINVMVSLENLDTVKETGSIFIGSEYPPLVYWITWLHYGFFGISEESLKLSLFLYSWIFILSLYGIGKRLGGYAGGICVSALAMSSPHIINMSFQYFPEVGQNAFTALAIYLILASERFSNSAISILLGIIISLSILCKWISAFFLILPILWFTVPVSLKSWKSFLTGLGIIGYIGYLLIKTANFYEKIPPEIAGIPWIEPLRENVLVPSLIIFASVIIGIIVARRIDRENATGTVSMLNLWACTVITMIMVLPWMYWSASFIKNKLLIEQNMPRSTGENASAMFYMLKTAFPLALPLMIVGFVMIFTRKKGLYERLLLPAGGFVAGFIMIKIGYPQVRYLMSVLIFAMALGGYWVGLTGKLKKPITLILVFLSLISMAGWTFEPEKYKGMAVEIRLDSPDEELLKGFFTPRLFFPERPQQTFVDFYPVLKEIKGDSDPDRPAYIHLENLHEEYFHLPITSESVYLTAFKMGKRIIFTDPGFVEGLTWLDRPDSFHIIILSRKDPTANSADNGTKYSIRGYRRSSDKIFDLKSDLSVRLITLAREKPKTRKER